MGLGGEDLLLTLKFRGTGGQRRNKRSGVSFISRIPAQHAQGALSLISSMGGRGRWLLKCRMHVSSLCSYLPSNFTLLHCLEGFYGVLLSVHSCKESSGLGCPVIPSANIALEVTLCFIGTGCVSFLPGGALSRAPVILLGVWRGHNRPSLRPSPVLII